MLKTFIAAATLALALATPAFAQSAADPDGVWQDKWGTTFTFQTCGDGTQLCGTLNDIQGDSRTPENLKYVNRQVVQAEQTAPNKWVGQIALNGTKAKAIVEQAASKWPDYFTPWLRRLGPLDEAQFLSIVNAIPADWMTTNQRLFCVRFLVSTCAELRKISP